MTAHSAASDAIAARDSGPAALAPAVRIVGLCAAVLVAPFLLNNYLIFWRGWPGPTLVGNFGGDAGFGVVVQGWVQLGLYVAAIALVAMTVLRTPNRPLAVDADWLTRVSLYVVRAGFWAVLLVGIVDMVISFLRVEGFLPPLVGDAMASNLNRANFRGPYIHFPLVILAFVIAYRVRGLGFIWLAFMTVMAEFMIVILRFVFSYEQAFMGDLVRFWYAALFLFASAYTLLEDAHVRVDILYARFGPRGKAWTNGIGSAVLGIPLCWVILTRGMASKATLINAPLLSYEVSQSGFGLFVKYLMAAFLIVYAVSMLAQFAGVFLRSAGVLLGQEAADDSNKA